MEKFTIKKLTKAFDIEIDSIASDKSISHRCAMFSLFSNETSYIKNYLTAEDTLNTLKNTLFRISCILDSSSIEE